jgi:hypothetical protein
MEPSYAILAASLFAALFLAWISLLVVNCFSWDIGGSFFATTQAAYL